MSDAVTRVVASSSGDLGVNWQKTHTLGLIRDGTMSAVPDEITVGAEGEQVPLMDVLGGRGFVTGKSGAGKSNTASVFAEELLECGLSLCIVDTDGEYYGLKEEYELLHAGAGKRCDVQVGPSDAGRLAKLALAENVPVILDLSGYLEESEARETVTNLSKELFAREAEHRKPFLMLVEEVHEFLPQGSGLDEAGEVLLRIAKRGRKRGLGLLGLSQRPAAVDKDFITQCDWLVWHRLTWKNDTDLVRNLLGADWAEIVEELDDGEAIMQADWNDGINQLRFRRKRTFDAGATPGLDDVDRPSLQSVDEKILAAFEDDSDAPAADDPEVLKDELDEKRERIAELEQKLEQYDGDDGDAVIETTVVEEDDLDGGESTEDGTADDDAADEAAVDEPDADDADADASSADADEGDVDETSSSSTDDDGEADEGPLGGDIGTPSRTSSAAGPTSADGGEASGSSSRGTSANGGSSPAAPDPVWELGQLFAYIGRRSGRGLRRIGRGVKSVGRTVGGAFKRGNDRPAGGDGGSSSDPLDETTE
jgi:hypothetical protein